MRATGIVRRIDELGRIVVPKEIRRTMRLTEGTPLEIFTDKDGQIILKKYSPMLDIGGFAKQYAESMAKAMNQRVAVTDRDTVIAVAGGGRKELFGKNISSQLEELIVNRESSTRCGKESVPITFDDPGEYSAQTICPICCEGDCIGTVIIYSRDARSRFTETEHKAAACAAMFLGKQMEG